MNYRTANRASSVTFDLKVEGDFVVPDGAVTYEVQDEQGVLIDTAVIPAAGANRVSVPLTPLVNTATAPDRPFRSVTIFYDVGGQEHEQTYVYQLTPWVLIPIAPEDVRGYLAASEQELPDRDMDLIHIYFDFQERTGLSVATLIAAGGAQASGVRAALKYLAVLSVLDTLELRMLQKEQGDNIVVSRFAKIDFDALRARVRGAYAAAVDDLLPDTEEPDYSLSVTRRPSPDPVTGAATS